MKCIIAGSRSLEDTALVYKVMNHMCPFVLDISEVVCGCAPGVDVRGRAWAKEHGFAWSEFPALWRDKDGGYYPSAGSERNERMAAYSDALVAIWDTKSKGTFDMIARARHHNLRIYIHSVVTSPFVRRRW